VTNAAVSSALGRRVDATSGSSLIRREAGELIIRASSEVSNATDAEWPAIIFLAEGARALATKRVEGLAFETPAYFEAEIKRAGSLEAWTAERYDTPAMWRSRLQLSMDSVAALVRVLAEGGPGAR
jgi:hypothetical protein